MTKLPFTIMFVRLLNEHDHTNLNHFGYKYKRKNLRLIYNNDLWSIALHKPQV